MTEDRKKELIAKAKLGDVRAFEELVALHEKKIFSFALSVSGGNYADAGDIYQEAIVKAFLNIKSFREESSFQTWLWKIVKNEFINYIQSPKTMGNITDVDAETFDSEKSRTIYDEIAEEERKTNLRKLISMMSPDFQEIITLIDLQEMSYQEASEIIGIKENLVKVRLFRAREKLAELAFSHEELFL